VKVAVQSQDFDVKAETQALYGDTAIGAVATFIGLVRDVPMTLEHYPGMTESAIRKIVEEARGRWRVLDCTVIHRYGELQPGDQIVLVVVASAHRGDAFEACAFIMDYLKTRAPFWKKEHRSEGARWVETRDSDDQAAQRWQRRSS
jgi:molybdopterin synthase catalytic subunit